MMRVQIRMMLYLNKSEILERRLILHDQQRTKIKERRKYSIGHGYLVEQVSVARIRRRLEQHLEHR